MTRCWIRLVPIVAALVLELHPCAAEDDIPLGGDFERQSIARAVEEAKGPVERAAAALKTAADRPRGVPRAGVAAPAEEDIDEVEASADGTGDRIVNGALTARYPSIGAVLKMENGKLGSWCTGTLIGCRTFVTAQHCVSDDPTPSQYRVFFHHGGLFGVTKIARHADYDFPFADLAVLTLAKDVTGIRPTPINDGAAIADGTEGKIVGFGRTGGTRFDYGLKRVGTVKTGPCRSDERSCVCWNYNATVSLPGENSNTCNADSGGPLLVVRSGSSARVLGGVTSGGTRSSCLSGDHSYDVDVRAFADWIKDKAGPDLGGASCTSLPRVGTAQAKYFATAVDLGPSIAKDLKFTVPAGVKLLRVTMNGEDKALPSGKAATNFNLYVKRGAVATKQNADCKQDDTSQVGVCEFENPAAEQWFLRIEEAGVEPGSAQAVVTMFSPS